LEQLHLALGDGPPTAAAGVTADLFGRHADPTDDHTQCHCPKLGAAEIAAQLVQSIARVRSSEAWPTASGLPS
jgi:hypothetical protein